MPGVTFDYDLAIASSNSNVENDHLMQTFLAIVELVSILFL